MGGVLVAGGVFGSLFGAWLFRLLQASGQLDTTIAIIYVLLLGSIGALMLREAAQTIAVSRGRIAAPARRRRHHPLVASLPLRMRFYRSGLYISPLAPAAARLRHRHPDDAAQGSAAASFWCRR